LLEKCNPCFFARFDLLFFVVARFLTPEDLKSPSRASNNLVYLYYLSICRAQNELIFRWLQGVKTTFYKLKTTFYKLKTTFYKPKTTFYKR